MFLFKFHVISFSYQVDYQNTPCIYSYSGLLSILEFFVAHESKSLAILEQDAQWWFMNTLFSYKLTECVLFFLTYKDNYFVSISLTVF